MNRRERRAEARRTGTPFVPQAAPDALHHTNAADFYAPPAPAGPDPAKKGVKGGNCNREACQAPGAVYYNSGTNRYYCSLCALRINEIPVNGKDLCTRDEEAIEMVRAERGYPARRTPAAFVAA